MKASITLAADKNRGASSAVMLKDGAGRAEKSNSDATDYGLQI